jgi:hypothetical protein
MKITGYKIREALRRWQLRRDTAEGQFNSTLFAFETDTKPHPDEVAKLILDAEAAIATLQVGQTRYNLGVCVEVEGFGQLTLLACIKRVGGLGRLEKKWRAACTAKEDRYAYSDPTTRDPTQLVARRVISFEEASKRTTALDKRLGALREAIAVGNAQLFEVSDLDVALFE